MSSLDDIVRDQFSIGMQRTSHIVLSAKNNRDRVFRLDPAFSRNLGGFDNVTSDEPEEIIMTLPIAVTQAHAETCTKLTELLALLNSCADHILSSEEYDALALKSFESTTASHKYIDALDDFVNQQKGEAK